MHRELVGANRTPKTPTGRRRRRDRYSFWRQQNKINKCAESVRQSYCCQRLVTSRLKPGATASHPATPGTAGETPRPASLPTGGAAGVTAGGWRDDCALRCVGRGGW